MQYTVNLNREVFVGRQNSLSENGQSMTDVFAEEECVVCLDGPPTKLLNPCKHKCMCDDCYRVVMQGNAECPLCRAAITGVAGNEEKAVAIDPEIRKTYFQRREEFLRTINLRCENENGDLVVFADSDVCLISDDMVYPIIVYYMGTTQYNPNKTDIRTEYVGNRMTFANGEWIVQGPCAKLTFPDFFKFVTETVVVEKKFVDHLRDQIFQHYLSGNTVAVEDNRDRLVGILTTS